MATEEITISELELADEVLADMTLPVDTATETRAVTLKQLRAWLGSSLPTGFIIPAVGKISDERFTLLDGKTLSREGTYEAFCNKVVSEVQAGNWFACSEEEYNSDISTYGQCGKFVVSNDYIRIPTITRFIGATITLSEIGKTYKESLPNITGDVLPYGGSGSYVGICKSDGLYKGAFKKGSNNVGITLQNVGGVSSSSLGFDASLSSSTYQNGAKVQPDHTKYPYYMVVSTEGQTAEVQIDINKVYEDLNLKANNDLSSVASVASSFKEASVGWGMPDYSAGVGKASNTQFTAESDGFLLYNYAGATSTNTLTINNININLTTQAQYSHGVALMLPIPKGTTYKLTGGGNKLIFYPLKGVN